MLNTKFDQLVAHRKVKVAKEMLFSILKSLEIIDPYEDSLWINHSDRLASAVPKQNRIIFWNELEDVLNQIARRRGKEINKSHVYLRKAEIVLIKDIANGKKLLEQAIYDERKIKRVVDYENTASYIFRSLIEYIEDGQFEKPEDKDAENIRYCQ